MSPQRKSSQAEDTTADDTEEEFDFAKAEEEKEDGEMCVVF
jgi:hypothetical protein